MKEVVGLLYVYLCIAIPCLVFTVFVMKCEGADVAQIKSTCFIVLAFVPAFIITIAGWTVLCLKGHKKLENKLFKGE